jgi:hypothetical protein
VNYEIYPASLLDCALRPDALPDNVSRRRVVQAAARSATQVAHEP